MKFEFCNKKKTNDLTADVVLVAAAAGAIAAGCVIAAYEALKSEKGQAAIAKTKAATVVAAGKVKETAVTTAGKVKATAATAIDAVKAKLPKKDEECACGCGCGPDCDCGCQEGKECTCEGSCTCGCDCEETTEAPAEA